MRHRIGNNYRLKRVIEVSVVLAADLISILAIFRLAVFMRTDLLPRIYSGFPTEFPHGRFIDAWWLFVVWIFFFVYEGLYIKRFSFWDEIKALWKAAIYSVVSIFTIVSLGKLSAEVSRTVILLMGLLAIILVPVARAALKRGLRKAGFLKRKAIILGAGETGRLILSALKREPNYGYEVLGFVDDDSEKQGKTVEGLKIHKGFDGVERYIGRCGIQDVFVATPESGWEKVQGLINSLQHKAERILFVPGISGIAVLGTNLQHFFHEQTFALELKNNLSEPFNAFIKRCFDLALCLLLLPPFFVLAGFIALAVRLDSKGPALFSHQRMGKKGRPFKCFKFRTMHKDAEERLKEILEKDSGAKEEWEQYWKLKDDPRVTRVGKFLRETSLDELPQIFNVLRGEMSLVGPRPYLPREEGALARDADTILLAKPGITGLWQVSGRSTAGYDYRRDLDLWYIRNWNPWIDIVIIFKTFRAVLKREGAY